MENKGKTPMNQPLSDESPLSDPELANYMQRSTPSSTWDGDDPDPLVGQPTIQTGQLPFQELRKKLQTALKERKRRILPTAPSYGQAADPVVPARRSKYSTSVSDILHMVKPFTGKENADRWLHTFELYAIFKNSIDEEKLSSLKLMLTEHAADWLTALPAPSISTYNYLVMAFKKRYGLSEAAKWKAEKDIWGRVQDKDESVDDYVTTMQLMANKVSMPSETLLKAIIQGLQPELRLFVLNSKASDIQELLTIARTCEAARSADTKQSSNIDTLTDMVGSLIAKVSQLTTDEQVNKKVKFAETAVSSERTGQHELLEHQHSNRNFECQIQQPRINKQQQSYQPESWRNRQGSSSYQRIRHPMMTRNYRQQTPVQQPPPSPWQPQPTGWWTPQAPGTWNAGQWNTAATPVYNNNTNTPNYRLQLPSGNCDFCGDFHPPGKSFCKAANVQCFRCAKIGHIAKKCRSAPTAGVYVNSH